MDENPCTEVLVESEKNLAPLYATLALVALMQRQPEQAERYLREMPRSERGRVRVNLEDLSMMIERLGN